MADKQLQELAPLTNPANEDVVLAVDVSDNNAPKKVTLSSVRKFVLESSPCIDATGVSLKLKSNLNANNMKLTKIAEGSSTSDAVTYGQVSDLITSTLPVLPAPTYSQVATHLRFLSTIAPLAGATYLFYYCLDTYAETTLTVSGNTVVSSSGATVEEIASPNHIATMVRTSGMVGKYLHLAVRYRNIKATSPLSATLSKVITLPSIADIIEEPGEIDTPTAQVFGSRLYVTSLPMGPGIQYQLVILFSNDPTHNITGLEEGLIYLSSFTPVFSYDISLANSAYEYIHYQLSAMNLLGQISTPQRDSIAMKFEDLFSDSLITLLANRISEKLSTADDVPLKPKL